MSNHTGFTLVSSGITDLEGTDLSRVIAAGTATDSPTSNDSRISIATDGSQALAITLPECNTNLGLTLTFFFLTDGGQDAVITRAGSDVISETGDTGNTAATLDDAGDFIQLYAAGPDLWIVISKLGATLS